MNRSERTWKWWKRSEEFESLPTPLHEIIRERHPDAVATGMAPNQWDSGPAIPPGQEIPSVYFMAASDGTTEQEELIMSSLDEATKQLLSIEGATGAAIVDYTSGMALAQGGNPGFDLGVAAAGNSNVVSSKLRTMADLGLDSNIEDVLITLDTQYHLINVLNSAGSKGLFVYLVLDRTYANLALARHKLNNIAKAVAI
ncbi:hypothetical protein J2790_001499 [Paenarthrobacter nicotinovorans]|uniref:Roadblock/LAMTOR2 domain-containing protein n=1 Tax=Paenarthrobacter nicotinovorans TaxID=29320 RepID=A0ABV0GX03_PAENI|nr:MULTISPECIES: hypothetical protein [Micrococcaceae]MDR6436378.1 hypothetical protein [Paenarthrobacter nicotinovorans]SCZ57880.1 hypothetical protein SAMN02799638_02311 [Arthrobacter sp. UNCCL28]